jgi:hypothetical protein
VYLFVVRGVFRKFLFMNLFLLLSVTTSVAEYAVSSRLGLASSQYFVLYFFTNLVLETFLFFSICQLSARLVGDKLPRWKVVLLGLGGIIVTAGLSFAVVSSMGPSSAAFFAFEWSQNISLACSLTIVFLWAWKLRNNPNDEIANRLVNVLSVYFLLLWLGYGASQLASHGAGAVNLSSLAPAWLPVGIGFALVGRE